MRRLLSAVASHAAIALLCLAAVSAEAGYGPAPGGTLATQNANAVAITGGTIDGTAIGGTTPAAGAFSTLTSTGTATFSGLAQATTGFLVPTNSNANVYYAFDTAARLQTGQGKTVALDSYWGLEFRGGHGQTTAPNPGVGSNANSAAMFYGWVGDTRPNTTWYNNAGSSVLAQIGAAGDFTALASVSTPKVVATTATIKATNAGLTAAGTSQATALSLVKDVNTLTTVASGAGVILSGVIGQDQQIYNRGANAVSVYPPSGASIESGAANAAVSLSTGAHATFICTSATQCYQAP